MTRSAERRRRGDEGQASVLLIMLLPVVMIVFALVWETGQMLAAKTELLTATHEAARAGTHQLDEGVSIDLGTPVVAQEDARRAAIDHLAAAGLTGRAEAEGDQVVVRAHAVYTPDLLPIGTRTIEAEGTARALPPLPR